MDLPAESQLRWLLRQSASLLAQGAEPVRGLILPTADFFPDVFDGTPKALAALVRRVSEHAGLAHLTVELTVVTPEGEAQTVSCASGACGGVGIIDTKLDRVTSLGDGAYRVTLSVGEIQNPVVLTTTLVRAVAQMFMFEAGAYAGVPPREHEPLTDLAAILLGFGVLMANGSYIYAKGCGGVKVHSATRMPVEEVAIALGIFCKLHDISARSAARHLDTTPREQFEESAAWASSNASVVRLLRKSPKTVTTDAFTLSPAHSWLGRAFGMGKKKPASAEDPLAAFERELGASSARVGAPARPKDEAKAKKLAELRKLVEESLEG